MEKNKLRGADIITSVLFLALGIWMLIEALQMPLKDSYAGVNSVWYVSPALLPLIIGTAIILLAVTIFVHALKNGGVDSIKAMWARRKENRLLSDANIRYASVLVPLLAMVYMNLTRIDFFLTIVLFLAFTITVFYIDDLVFFRKTLYFYAAEMFFLLILSVFNLDALMNGLFVYAYDVLALLLIIALTVFMSKQLSKTGSVDYQKKFKRAMLMVYLTPLLVVPIFRFVLRVPLPKEGGIVNLMALVYYTLR